ncbi:GNAT family N-acetyltransferase [Catenulispora rubra]|uniref:GNAT family N-acetyltransferase n=1 Tax=Catenulispora rubra TaxID=280293 RepID=UPI0018922171|nr:GNAT family N-acetyltransferase [Catenulispora rubra]
MGEDKSSALMAVEIGPFDPSSASDAELAESYAVMSAVMTEDHPDQALPPLEEYVALIRRPLTELGPMRRWVAREAGRIIAAASVSLPENENRHLTIVRVIVPPERRRRGLGTALLRAVLPAAVADGRTVVMGSGVKADASGELWARGLGFVRTLAYVRQFLTIADVDPALWERPVADGFRLERWTGAAPEALLEEYARARTAMLDAPRGESVVEFEDWTPERVREHEADCRARDIENRVVVAVHEDSGRVAAVTEVDLWASQPGEAAQRDTVVAADFRGRGLGLAVKGAMLRRLTADRPAIGLVWTHTAQDNDHMIRINHALGYVTTAVMTYVEVGADELAKRLEAR